MPNVASVLKEEIRRLAKKEARILTRPLKQALNAERKQMAALRKQVASLARESRNSARAAAKVVAPAQEGAVAAPVGWRKDTVRSTRKMLGLTQGQMAKLIGVSPISISLWENGRNTPRSKAQVKVLEARKLSRADAQARLGIATAGKARGRRGAGTRRAAHKAAGRRQARGAGRKRVARKARGAGKKRVARKARGRGRKA